MTSLPVISKRQFLRTIINLIGHNAPYVSTNASDSIMALQIGLIPGNHMPMVQKRIFNGDYQLRIS